MIELALTHYTALKFVHVLSAVVWVGGACVVQVYALLALRTNDPVRVAAFAGDTEFVGTRDLHPGVADPARLRALHVHDERWRVELQPGLGAVRPRHHRALDRRRRGYLGPEAGRIARATEARGVESAEVQERIRRIFLISRIELVLLLAVIFDMVVKPGM